MPPHNRKQRRAAATAPDDDPFDASSIPLAHPPASVLSSQQRVKTLYEIAAERQAELSSLEGATSSCGIPPLASQETKTEFVKISPSGEVSRFDPSASLAGGNGVWAPGMEADEPIPPLPDTILLSLPLSILHFTLS